MSKHKARRRLTRDRAARYLGLSYWTLARPEFPVPTIRVGRRVLYDTADLDAFLAARRDVASGRTLLAA